MSAGSIVVLTFAATALSVLGLFTLLFDLFFRNRSRLRQRMNAELRDEMHERVQQSPLFKDLQQMARERALPTPTWWGRLQLLLEQSGLNVTAAQLVLYTMLASTFCGLAGGLLRGWLTGMIAAAIVAPLPLMAVLSARARRIRRLCWQLPDAFDVMGRALKAGQTMPAAFQIVATDFRPPISEEFAFCHEQQHLGIAPEIALRDLARRTGIMELRIFVVALIVHKRSGGRLSELLNKLSELVRKRIRMQARLKAITGEGRMQAYVLTASPMLMFLGVWLVNPSYAEVLLERPYLVAGTLASQAVGALCIRHIMSLSY